MTKKCWLEFQNYPAAVFIIAKAKNMIIFETGGKENHSCPQNMYI